MCSRLDNQRDVVTGNFNIDAGDPAAQDAKWGEIFPTDPTLVIGPDRQPIVRRWGLVADWSNRPIINARSEEVTSKRSFQRLLQDRCLIPVTGYYEWRVDGERKIKTKIHANGILPIAGLMTSDRFVLFTCAPNPQITHIHDRMPAILADEDAITDWLNPDADFAELQPLLIPYAKPLAFTEIDQPPRPTRVRPEPRQASLF